MLKSENLGACSTVLLIAATLFAAGCGRTSSSSDSGDVLVSGSSGKGMSQVSVDGVTISYPSSFDSKGTNIHNNDVTLEFVDHHICLEAGALTVDGNSYGKVTKGDTVRVEKDGSVHVNSNRIPLQGESN